jgi:hypothetical protein
MATSRRAEPIRDASATKAIPATSATPRALIEESADYPVPRSNWPAGQTPVRSLGSEQPPTHQPAGPAAVTTASGEWGMTAPQAAEAPPQPAQARSLAVHGGALDERKRWPQCPSSLVERDCPANGMSFQCAASRRIVRNSATETQTLTTGRTLVRVGRASAKGSSSRSSVTSRLTFLRMTARAALPSTASATAVAAPMPSQNHTGMVIISALTAASKPTVACIRTSFGRTCGKTVRPRPTGT